MPALSVDGDRLSYTDEGDRNAIIFVHGSCGGAAQWKALSGRLSADYRTICPDLFGNGRSEPWSVSRHWSPDDDRRAFEAIFDMLAESAHFVIHSIGAHAAYPTIRDRPDRIRSITFFEPVYFHLLRGIDPLISESEQLASRFRSSMEEGERERAMEGFIDTWAKKGTWASLPEPVKAQMRLGADRLYHECELPWFTEPTLDDLRNLRLPVLLFKGSHAIPSMHRVCQILEETLPDCRLIEIEGAGHMVPFTHTDAVLPAIRDHLTR